MRSMVAEKCGHYYLLSIMNAGDNLLGQTMLGPIDDVILEPLG